MPSIVVPNAALVRLVWSDPQHVWNNVLGANVLGATVINQALADALATSIRSAFTTHLAAQVSALAGFGTALIRDIRQANMPEYVGSGADVPGSAVGDPLPPSSALVVTLKTGRAGQSFRGRVYLAGFTEDSNDSAGHISSATNAAAVAFVTAISTAFGANGLALAIVSRPAERVQIVRTTFHGDGTTSVETTTNQARAGQVTPVVGISARNNLWDSQRRRGATGTSGSTLLRSVASSDISSGEPVLQLPEELENSGRTRK